MKQAILNWLRRRLAADPRVSQCWLFGSYTQPLGAYRDVDIILVIKERNIRRWKARLVKSFSRAFHKTLDIQIFHKQQVSVIKSFFMAVQQGYGVKKWGLICIIPFHSSLKHGCGITRW